MARSAYREAVAYFEQALRPSRICRSSATRASRPSISGFDLRNALLPLGEHGRILDHLREAEALAERLGRSPAARLDRVLSVHLISRSWASMTRPLRPASVPSRSPRASGAFDLQVVAQIVPGHAY